MENKNQKTIDRLSFDDAELVIALVAPVGTDVGEIQQILTDRLRQFRYTTHVIRVTEIIQRLKGLETELHEEPPYARYESYMNAGDEARRRAEAGDFLALGAAYAIAQQRTPKKTPHERVAYIVRSLKHPGEVDTLRKIYGRGLWVIGVYAPRETRIAYLTNDKGIPIGQAKQLMERDEAAGDEFGQRTRDAFELADVFVSTRSDKQKEQLWRAIDLMFGQPHTTPSRDEYAMFLSYAASLRSGDLSRQVGAVVTNRSGEIIATGANNVPRFGGGLYWPQPVEEGVEPKDERDHVRGEDSNAVQRDKIVTQIMRRFGKGREQSDAEIAEEGRRLLDGTGVLDLTEYGRAAHAEMEALLCCARIGVSPVGGTLYSTTFPCHNCSKHLVAAGVKRVVYVEPYPKSLARELHGDAIQIDPIRPVENKVAFVPFVGVGPRRFFDLFSMKMSSGLQLTRKRSGGRSAEWTRTEATVRSQLLPTSYLDREQLALVAWSEDFGEQG